MRYRDAWLCSMALVGTVAGCDSSDTLDAAEAARLVTPRREHFGRIERWTRRVLIADPVLRNRDAIAETLFAPMRRDDALLGVWVRYDRLVLQMKAGVNPPSALTWTPVRDDELGVVEVATGALGEGGRAARCAFLVKRWKTTAGAAAELMVAYRLEPEFGE